MQELGGFGDVVTRRLVALQGRRTDREMALLLGCSRPYYYYLRTGKRRVSYAMAKRAAQIYPEIMALFMRDLMMAEGAGNDRRAS